MDQTVLLVAHGSRVAAAAQEAQRLRAAVQERHGPAVHLGWIELSEPLAIDLAADLADGGAGELVVQPLLLLPGNHARFDVDAVARSAHDHGATVRVGQALGSDVRLLAVAEDHVRSAGPADALLVVASATASDAAMRSLDASAALVARGSGHDTVVAAAATLDGAAATAALDQLAADGRRRIVVLPWMLLPGRLEAATTAALADRARDLGVEVVLAERFGAADGVVDAVLRQVARARPWADQPSTPSGG